jgi:hypothetical protein
MIRTKLKQSIYEHGMIIPFNFSARRSLLIVFIKYLALLQSPIPFQTSSKQKNSNIIY